MASKSSFFIKRLYLPNRILVLAAIEKGLIEVDSKYSFFGCGQPKMLQFLTKRLGCTLKKWNELPLQDINHRIFLTAIR